MIPHTNWRAEKILSFSGPERSVPVTSRSGPVHQSVRPFVRPRFVRLSVRGVATGADAAASVIYCKEMVCPLLFLAACASEQERFCHKAALNESTSAVSIRNDWRHSSFVAYHRPSALERPFVDQPRYRWGQVVLFRLGMRASSDNDWKAPMKKVDTTDVGVTSSSGPVID